MGSGVPCLVCVPFEAGVAVTPDGNTAFVTDMNGKVSTLDLKTRTKDPTDIDAPSTEVAITPDGKTAFTANVNGTVSTFDVNTRTKHPDDIAGVLFGAGVALTPDGKTAFVVSRDTNSVWTIDVKSRGRDSPRATEGSCGDRLRQIKPVGLSP
jgi:DNA-binding beta-propeller fold protein YncE